EDPAQRYATALAFTSALEAADRGAGADMVTPVGAIAPISSARPAHSAKSEVAPPHVELIETEPDPQFAMEPEVESIVDPPKPVEVAPVPEEEEEEELRDVAASGPTILDNEPATIEDATRGTEPPRMWQYEPPAEEAPVMRAYGFIEPERPRGLVVPVTLGVLIGMLIGLAGGYALASRWRTQPVQEASSAARPPQVAPGTSATPSQPQRSGRAWSEQAVAQPAAPPPAAEAAPPPRPTRGTLTIESTPKNAAVTVNGRWR